jgi:hypothetical protein
MASLSAPPKSTIRSAFPFDCLGRELFGDATARIRYDILSADSSD